MIIAFNDISEYAKLWVFPSSRKFYKQEISELHKSIDTFLKNWCLIDDDFRCAFEIKYDRFICVAVDDFETRLSIETHNALANFIQDLEKKYDIVLLDKINVCYKQGEFVQYKDLKEFKKIIKAKGVSEKTIVFNNMISSKEELEYNWEINIKDSWLGRFL